jgi:high-affinity Fe2+/Pb2+ permease
MTPLLIAIVAAMFYGSIIWLLHRAHKRREQSDYECVNRQQEQSIRRHAQQWRWQ